MNQDLTILLKARKTALQLLRDRKYEVPDIFDCDDITEFKQLYQNKRLDIFVKQPSKCYIKFIILNKSRPQVIREYIEEIQSRYTGEDGQIIIILKSKPHNTLFKVIKEYKNLQFFWLSELINNITKHSLNPRFIKLEEDEIAKLLEKYKLKNKLSLPIMLSTDPICKYFNYKVGDVCRIQKSSPTSGSYTTYRTIK